MKNKKVVINKCFGGFSLSPEAIFKYAELSGFKVFGYTEERDSNGRLKLNERRYIRYDSVQEPFNIYWLKNDIGDNPTNEQLNNASWFHETDIPRDDKNLVKTIEILGEKANDRFSSLSIVEIPSDVDFEIDEYDGMESIHEKHRSWG